MRLLERINRVLIAGERTLNFLACMMLFLIMLIVVVDVVLRYFFNSPLGWSYELISLYLMVGVFFFALSDTLNANGHVCVDLLQHRMSDSVRRASEVVSYACASVVFLGIVVVAWDRTLTSYDGAEVVAGTFAWPTWISSALVFLGSLMLLLRMIFRLAGHFLSLILRRAVIALPPISGTGESESC